MGIKVDRAKFFSEYRDVWGGLSQQQTNGLTHLLDCMEQDLHLTRIEWASYMLATTKHETANTFMPIHEYGGHAYFVRRYGSQTAVGHRLGNLTPEEGAMYAGEGDVQLTGHGNFAKANAALRREYPDLVQAFEARTGQTFDLVKNPSEAGDPDLAYAIMSYGMRSGMFTGRHLPDIGRDYRAWRAIINGTDQAEHIAVFANTFEHILRSAYVTFTSLQAPQIPATEPSEQASSGTATPPAGEGASQDTSSNPPTTAPGSAASEQAPPPPVAVQTVVTDTTQTQSSLDQQISKWSARYTAIPAAMFSGIAAIWTWATSAPAHLVETIFIIFGAITIVYIGLEKYFKYKGIQHTNELAEADKQRAHEVQLALIASAARKDQNTVELVPPPVPVETTTASSQEALPT